MFTNKKILFIFTIIFLSTAFVLGGFSKTSAQFIFDGTIAGQVTDSQTGQEISGVDLKFIFSGTFEETVSSDINGNYSFTTSNCGFPDIDLQVSAAGYVSQTFASIAIPCFVTTELDIELEPENQALDPVILIPGILGSWEVGQKDNWVLDPILHVYDNLWQALQNSGYVVDETLFAHPYQWRQSNVLTAIELKDKIAEIKQTCACSKVDLVAHSMGGLVARSYIQGIDYQADVDQVIFLGTPHRGSPETYPQWEAAAGFPNNPIGFLQKKFFQLEALQEGYLNLINYIQNEIITVEQLLPIYDYLKEAATDSLRAYPTNYPQNTFSENLNVSSAIDLLKSRASLTNIIGDFGSSSTINIIRVVPDPDPTDSKWTHGMPENFGDEATDQGLEKGTGDGTVPLASQDSLGDDIDKVFINSEHRLLPTNAQQDIIEILTGTRPAEFVELSAIEKILLVDIKSPADFYILAPSGKRLGKDFLTGNTFSEIPLGFYPGYNLDIEFATVPNPQNGQYQIVLEGTDEGSYKIDVNLIEDKKIVTKSFSGFIEQDLQEILNFDFDSSSPETLEIEPEDQNPPIITINSPQAGQVFTHQDTLTIDYEAVDDTGIQSDQATLASQLREVSNGQVIDLFFEEIGSHSLTVVATDYLGNIATSTTEFDIIATANSLIQDIKEAYQQGWIKHKALRNSLLQQARSIHKAKNKFAKKIKLNVLLKQLEIFHSIGIISDEGYNLLKGDVEYLINNL